MGVIYGLIAAVLVIGVVAVVRSAAGKAWRGIPTSGHIAAAQSQEADRRTALQGANDLADETIRAEIRDLNVSQELWMAAGGSARQYSAYAAMDDDTRRHWLGSHSELTRYLFPDGLPGPAQG